MASGSSVFISYAADTKSRAQELTQALEKHGFEAWAGFKNLRPGQRWREELERAVASADWLLILVGADSRNTAWQEAEWSTALARSWTDSSKRLLPVIFGQAEPPPFLSAWVALRVDPDREPAAWTRHVLDAMRSVWTGSVSDHAGQSRHVRRERFDEIRMIAEELRRDSPDELPLNVGARSD